jgi:hypothetical protein
MAAVVEFCKKVGLPVPLTVSSGGGLHVYWPLTTEITRDQWKPIAEGFKALLTQEGFIQDNSRTADSASVLRTPGTINRKPNRPERAVRVLHPGSLIDIEVFSATVEAALHSEIREIIKPVRFDVNSEIASAFASDMQAHVVSYADSSAVEVASKCKQLANMRDTQGDLDYMTWRSCLGVIKHCVDAEEVAIKWTERRAETGHGQADPLTAMEDWKAGPTSCAYFKANTPSGCKDCEWVGKVTSPIQLGVVPPEQDVTEEVATIDGQTVILNNPAPPLGYAFLDHGTSRFLKDKDGRMIEFHFLPLKLYVTHRCVNESNSWSLALRAALPRGKFREFTIPTATLASGTELLKVLGDKEIVTTTHKDAVMHLTAYLKDSLAKLMREADEVNTMTSFGWHYDMKSFLIGDRLYHQDGTIRKVLLGSYAADLVNKAFPVPTGTLEGYSKPLNDIYNRPGMEPMQYAICSGFGSLLSPMGEDLYCGLLCALTGKSGKGKSTACQAMLYAFGDAANALTVSGDKHAGATDNGRYALLGTYKNIPMLFDEVTNMDAAEFSRLAYTVSLGRDKTRLNSGAGRIKIAAPNTWRMAPFATANKDIHLALSEHVDNSEAEAVRVVQIRTDKYNIPELPPEVVVNAITQIRRNMGVAGEVFVKYLVTNIEDVHDMWRATMEQVTERITGAKFRFYRNHAACSLTALQITNRLGITEFDYDTVFDFTVDLMRTLVDDVNTNNTPTPEESFNRMIAALTPRIIVTQQYRDARDSAGLEQVNRINDAIAGRYVTHDDSKSKYGGHMFIVWKEFRSWCGAQRVDFDGVIKYLEEHDAIVQTGAKFTLTRGTSLPLVQQRVVGINLKKLEGAFIPILDSDDPIYFQVNSSTPKQVLQ